MRTYADARHCPDCGNPLPDDPRRCPACGLSLVGPVAASLFATFQQADRLLAQLRAQPADADLPLPPTPPARPVPAAVPPAVASGDLPGSGPQPIPAGAPERPGLGGASVPRILLTLGALCLLAAAVTFLAVAWEILGVGGRTAVLVGFTLTAGALTAWLFRRGLRIAAESLSVVTAGLLTLDLVGAADAGWIGASDGGLVLLIGVVLGSLGIAATAATRRTAPLVAPQIVGALGWAVAPAGALDLTDHESVVLLVATIALAALAGICFRARIGVVGWLLAPLAALWWSGLVLTGLVRLADHQDAGDLWRGGHPWPLLAAALVLAAAAAVLRDRQPFAAVGAGVATGMAMLPAVSPVLDNSATQAALATLAVAGVFVVAGFLLPGQWRPGVLLPMLAALVVPTLVAVALASEAAEALVSTGSAWTRAASVRLPDQAPSADPLLLPLTAVMLLAAVAVLVQLRLPVRGLVRGLGWPLVVVAATPVALAAVAALSLYAVPLALPVGALLALGTGLVAAFLPIPAGRGGAGHLAAAVALAAGLVASLPSVVLTLVSLVVVLGAGAAAAVRAVRAESRMVALASVPLTVGALAWTLGELGGLQEAWRATAALLLLGALALWRPRPTVEVPAALAGLVTSAASVGFAFGHSESQGLVVLALDLTVAGALVTASSLAHPHRRVLAVPGGLLLAMATWVRLYDLGVTAPEAYTLPSALVLLALGVWHLRRHPSAATLRVLGPGLTLATVPSLLWALEEPESWRALLLGLAALGLVLAGVRLRWTAPLVVGAVVGAVLVVREVGPYAVDLPPWLVIAVAGATLTAVGVTWEARMRDVRRAGRYLAALR
ncbi:SCO7613 C-terminal domain-containing membrane protein [Nocardioides sp.]|uniref:SCO7613 C-terminal domain-containing membrane protein n=1 Tax=Nocardioides sp. TaxID=35761 RepID=UPI003527F36E